MLKLIRIIGVLVILTFVGLKPVAAQVNTSSLSVRPGQVIEIYASSSTQQTVNWALTKGGEFLQADRGPIFTTRPTATGIYHLGLEVSKASDEPLRQIISLNIDPDLALPEGAQADEAGLLVRADPPINEAGTVVLDSKTQLLKLDLINPEIEQIALDPNTAVDSNGDNDPDNDDVLGKSVIRNGNGTFYMWLPPDFNEQTILLAARLKNGSFLTQEIVITAVASNPVAAVSPPPTELIAVTDLGAGKYQFAAKSDRLPRAPLVIWNFGDGEQSLQTTATHRFLEAGDFQVSLLVRDLESGTVALEAERSINVPQSAIDAGVDARPDEPAPTPTKPDGGSQPTKNEGGGFLKTIGWGILLFVIVAGVVVLIIFLASKAKGLSLQKSLEKAEDKLVGDDGGKNDEPPPLELTATVTPATEKDEKKTDESPAKPDKPEPVEPTKTKEPEPPKPAPEKPTPEKVADAPIANKQVPSWLAPTPPEGLQSSEPKPTEPPETATPEKKSTDATPEPEPKQAEQKVPDWLKGSGSAAAPTASSPPPPTQPKEPKTPNEPKTSNPPNKPKEADQPAAPTNPPPPVDSTPPWLKQQTPSTPAAPAPTQPQAPNEPNSSQTHKTPNKPDQSTTEKPKETDQPATPATPPPPPANATPPWLQSSGSAPTASAPPLPNQPKEPKEPEKPAAPTTPPPPVDSTPPWLKQAQSTPPTPPPAQPQTPNAPKSPNEPNKPDQTAAPATPPPPVDSTPPWLQNSGSAPAPTVSPTPTPNQPNEPKTPNPPTQPKTTDHPPAPTTPPPTPAPAQPQAPNEPNSPNKPNEPNQPNTPNQPNEPNGADQKNMSKEEQERERKRKKRQRYRANRKKREAEAKAATANSPQEPADDDIQFIVSADSVEGSAAVDDPTEEENNN